MVCVRQRSADFFVRYAIVDADRQGVTSPLNDLDVGIKGLLHLEAQLHIPSRTSSAQKNEKLWRFDKNAG